MDQVRRAPGGGVVTLDGQPVTVGRSEKMSKSKANTVDPAQIIETYGADTARWFMLSDSPPDRDMDWTEAGIEGAFRFIQRLWRLVMESLDDLPAGPGNGTPPELDARAHALRRASHKAIAAVTDDVERFRFNRAVARLYELSNTLADFEAESSTERWALREAFEVLVRLIGPMTPHLAEELWQRLGHKTLLVDEPWPTADATLLVDETVTLAVQVNGKLRATIILLTEPAVQRAMGDRAARKVIVVKNRVVNVVV
jgi:leucyl-tRNA synthetase